jgi:hypothetical protein
MTPEPARITESVVEQAALDWLGGLGYEILSGMTIAPDELRVSAVAGKLSEKIG